MKEYFDWVCTKCSKLWDLEYDTVAGMLINGYPVPKAYSIDKYILYIERKKK